MVRIADNLDVRPSSVDKQAQFEKKFHLIIVSIFLKTFVKDHGDSSSRLLERRNSSVCIEELLLAVL